MSAQAAFYLTFATLAATTVAVLVADAFGGRRWARWLAVAGLALAGASAVYAGVVVAPAVTSGGFLVGGIFSAGAGAVLLLTALAVAAADDDGPIASLAVIAAFGVSVAIAASNVVSLLIGLETASLCAYALVARTRTRVSGEAAMKYFVQGAVATGFFAMGIAVLVGGYAFGGGYGQLAAALAKGPVVPGLAACLLVSAALVFKAGGAPFHSWAPDAYEAAAPIPAAVLAGPVKVGVLIALALITTAVAPLGASPALPLGRIGADLLPIIGVLGALSVIVGSLVALRTPSYTRMLGYAGVAQVGYALIAVAALNPGAVAVFVVTYGLAAVGAFVAAGAIRAARPEWDGTISGMGALGRERPWLAGALTLLLMSSAGVPPLLGFWGKFEAFGSAVARSLQYLDAGYAALGTFYAVLVVVGVAGSIVSLGYYGAVVRALFFGSQDGAGDEAVTGGARSTDGATVVTIVSALLVLVLGLVPLLTGLGPVISVFVLRR